MAEKIGVYFDQSALGIIDGEELAAHVGKKFGGACPVAKVFPVLAAESARAEIRTDIEEEGLDGVLLCGASPRVDWDLYDFEGVLVDRVNLREHCAMAFMDADGSVPEAGDDAPELLMLLAKDYVNMGVFKLQKTKAPTPPEFETVKTIMVIGGGWAGLTAAKQAADYGFDVILVEKDAALGGKALGMLKTAPLEYPYTEAHENGIEKKIADLTGNEKIKVITGARLERLEGLPGQYKATVKGEVFPVGAVVLAAGWVPQNTKVLAPLGYGSVPNVVTAAEFEKMAKEGTLSAKRVAFVLNTGLVDGGDIYAPICEEAPAEAPKKEEGEEGPKYVHKDLESVRHLPISNAISSVVALKQANYVCDTFEDCQAFILYDSMVVQGIHERYYKAAQNRLGIMMSKADIKGIAADGDEIVISAANTLMGGDVEIAVDMVVLPTGLVPATAKDPIMNFVYRQGPNFPDLDLFEGYADSNYICFPYETRRTGVYAAGCVRQPMMLDAAEEDAIGATLKAIQCIESANRGVAVHPRSGDLSYPVFNFVRCTQCKRCTEECPFGALDDDEKGTPLPNYSRCRRCGTCMGACPERVISFDNYNIDQIGTMIREVYVPDNMETGGPRVIILACENDAYPALDMAAIRGKKWSPYVRIIPVRCLGSVNAIWVADAMSKGIDGVMLLGCKYGDDYQCHFVKGSEICNRRKDNIAETLNRLGVEPDRVEQYEVAIDEYDKVPGMIEEFMQMIFEKGPNPFKGY
ncbi:MAG: hydrogenase iron-sulfur subunit [Halodesulfovibrio sp.]